MNGKAACPRCDGTMQEGAIRTVGEDFRRRIAFVIPGTPTSWNPLVAFRQGIADEPNDQIFLIDEMTGLRCQDCGYLELYTPRNGRGSRTAGDPQT